MGLFGKDKSPKSTGANPHIATTTTGFASLKDAAAAAPEKSGDDSQQPQPKRGRKSAAPQQTSANVQDALDAKRKAELKAKAMEAIGQQICAELASVPYDTWAFLVDDTEVSLTPEEKKDLTEKYYLLAQSLEPDFSSPMFLIVALSLQNLVLVAKRLKMRAVKKAELKAELEAGAIPDAPVN